MARRLYYRHRTALSTEAAVWRSASLPSERPSRCSAVPPRARGHRRRPV